MHDKFWERDLSGKALHRLDVKKDGGKSHVFRRAVWYAVKYSQMLREAKKGVSTTELTAENKDGSGRH